MCLRCSYATSEWKAAVSHIESCVCWGHIIVRCTLMHSFCSVSYARRVLDQESTMPVWSYTYQGMYSIFMWCKTRGRYKVLHLLMGFIFYDNVSLSVGVFYPFFICMCVCVSVRTFCSQGVVCAYCVLQCVCLCACNHQGSLSEKGQGGTQRCQRGQQEADRGDTRRGLWWHLHSGNRPSQHNDEQGSLLLMRKTRRMRGELAWHPHTHTQWYTHKFKCAHPDTRCLSPLLSQLYEKNREFIIPYAGHVHAHIYLCLCKYMSTHVTRLDSKDPLAKQSSNVAIFVYWHTHDQRLLWGSGAKSEFRLTIGSRSASQ